MYSVGIADELSDTELQEKLEWYRTQLENGTELLLLLYTCMLSHNMWIEHNNIIRR